MLLIKMRTHTQREGGREGERERCQCLITDSRHVLNKISLSYFYTHTHRCKCLITDSRHVLNKISLSYFRRVHPSCISEWSLRPVSSWKCGKTYFSQVSCCCWSCFSRNSGMSYFLEPTQCPCLRADYASISNWLFSVCFFFFFINMTLVDNVVKTAQKHIVCGRVVSLLWLNH